MVKAGYKQTEIGVIPEDWNLQTVNDTLELLTDFEANGSFESVAHNVKIHDSSNYAWYVRATDLENNSNLSDVKYVDKHSYSFLKKTPLFGGEVLITKRGEIGKVYYFKQKYIHATLAPNMYLLKLNKNVVVPYFVYFFFKSKVGNKLLLQKNASSTLGALYKDDVKAIYFPIPPKEEQKAIAKALSDTDALITALEDLIAKKEAIKQGTMQQLLTGKKRLEGFSGAWEEKRLGDLFDITAGGDLKKDQYSETKGEKYKYPIFANSVFQKGLYGYSTFFSIEKESITVTARGTLGVAFYRNRPFVAIGRLLILQPKIKINCFFCTESINLTLHFANESTSVPQLTAPQISQYEIKLPPTVKEQQAIAQILSDMDNELEALKAKLTKTKAIKEGMMSELLTGKTRLNGAKDE